MIDGSIIMPARNEEAIIGRNLESLMGFLKGQKVLGRYEVVVSDYSSDSTPAIVRKLAARYPQLRLVRAPRSGIGAGIKAGVESSRYDAVMYYQSDMAFSPKSITDTFLALEKKKRCVVVVSRRKDGSTAHRPLSRRVASAAYNAITRGLFGVSLSDTQGTLAFRKSEVAPFWGMVRSDLGVMQTEVLYLASRSGLGLVEIPGVNKDSRNASLPRVLGIGLGMLIDIGTFSVRRLWERPSAKAG